MSMHGRSVFARDGVNLRCNIYAISMLRVYFLHGRSMFARNGMNLRCNIYIYIYILL